VRAAWRGVKGCSACRGAKQKPLLQLLLQLNSGRKKVGQRTEKRQSRYTCVKVITLPEPQPGIVEGVAQDMPLARPAIPIAHLQAGSKN